MYGRSSFLTAVWWMLVVWVWPQYVLFWNLCAQFTLCKVNVLHLVEHSAWTNWTSCAAAQSDSKPKYHSRPSTPISRPLFTCWVLVWALVLGCISNASINRSAVGHAMCGRSGETVAVTAALGGSAAAPLAGRSTRQKWRCHPLGAVVQHLANYSNLSVWQGPGAPGGCVCFSHRRNEVRKRMVNEEALKWAFAFSMSCVGSENILN